MIDLMNLSSGEALVITSVLLVSIGLFTVITRRNLIRIIIGLEVLATGVNLNFIAMSLFKHGANIDPTTHALTIISIVLDGALVGVALALTLVVYRKFRTLNTDEIRKLRW